MLRFSFALLSCVTALVLAPALASAAGVAYPDADWSQAWIPSSDGVTLHADVLRPKGATADTKTPVILSIGPYFNHSGQTGPGRARPRARSYDPVGPNAGPSERFQDFVEGSGLLKKGYTLRDGRPARLRRLERLPRLVRARRAGRRRQRGQVGGEPAVVDRQGRHVRQVLRRR